MCLTHLMQFGEIHDPQQVLALCGCKPRSIGSDGGKGDVFCFLMSCLEEMQPSPFAVRFK